MNAFAVAFVLGGWAFEHLAGPHAAVFHGREAAGVHGFGDQRAGHAVVERELAHPLAGAFRAGAVHDLIDEPAVAVFIFHAEDVARDFDQVAVELAAIPFGEDVVQLVVREAEGLLHHEVGFADELHVAVFDAVVNHLHVMPGAARADPFAAGDVVLRADFGGDRLEDRLHGRPGVGAAAGHHAGAFEGALFAAGNARADVEQALCFDALGPPFGIGVVGIAAVDEDVALFEQRDAACR